MKKVGHFFLTLLPFLLVTGIQFLATFFSFGISLLIESCRSAFSGKADTMGLLERVSNLWVTQDFNSGIMIVYAALTIVVFGLWYYIGYEGVYVKRPHTIFHPLSILGIVMLVPGMQYLSTYIVSFTANLFPQWLKVYEELLETAGLDDNIKIGMLLYSVLFAPICEELVFRGVTLRQAKRCFPFWAANVMQAVLFGAFHMNMIQGIYAFFLGIILGYICEKSNSIHNAILLHMLFNFWGTVLSRFFSIGNTAFAVIFWFIFAIAMTAAGLFVFTAGARRCVSTGHSAQPSQTPDRLDTPPRS